MAPAPAPVATPKVSDLRVRTLSAVVMVVVAGMALWLGGWIWTGLVTLVMAGVLWEWIKLSTAIASGILGRAVWFVAGLAYLGMATMALWHQPLFVIVIIIACVVATDIGAYFTGRTFGGPKIAPRISPSKTWAGLGGGMLAAGLAFWAGLTTAAWQLSLHNSAVVARFYVPGTILKLMVAGALVAIIAQAGDFFESWMKRRAGVKDSGHVIPGHGGLFDRVDGLLAVLFVAGIVATMGRFL